jgi:hypothetical protein
MVVTPLVAKNVAICACAANASELGVGKLTRRNVRWLKSGTVNRSLGKGLAVGSRRSNFTLTPVAAVTVARSESANVGGEPAGSAKQHEWSPVQQTEWIPRLGGLPEKMLSPGFAGWGFRQCAG